MSLVFRGIFASGLALALLSGCATTELPPPVRGAVEGTLSFDVPPEFAERAAVPPQAEGRISLTFESQAIQSRPIRSRFDGKVTLLITDPQKTRRYVDFAVTLSGEFDGPPNEGWARAVAQASDLINMFCKGLRKPEAERQAH